MSAPSILEETLISRKMVAKRRTEKVTVSLHFVLGQSRDEMIILLKNISLSYINIVQGQNERAVRSDSRHFLETPRGPLGASCGPSGAPGPPQRVGGLSTCLVCFHYNPPLPVLQGIFYGINFNFFCLYLPAHICLQPILPGGIPLLGSDHPEAARTQY